MNQDAKQFTEKLHSFIEQANQVLLLFDLERIINHTVQLVESVIGYHDYVFMTYDHDQEEYAIRQNQGLCDEEYIDDQGILDWVMKQRKVMSLSVDEEVEHSSDHHVLCIPFHVKGKPVAILQLDTGEDVLELTHEQTVLLDILSSPVGLAIESKRLYLEMQHMALECSKAENFVNNVLEHVSLGVVSFDRQGVITHINQYAYKVFGAGTDSVVGKPYQKSFAPEVVKFLKKTLAETYRNGPQEHLVMELAGRDDLIYTSLSSSPVKNNKGEVEGVIVTAQDMTLSREIERLKKLDEIKTQFVTSITRDLKGPLTALKGALGAFMRKMSQQDEETRRQFVKSCHMEAESVLEMIEDIVLITQIESGSLVLSKQTLPVLSSLEEIISRLSVEPDKCLFNIDVDEFLTVHADKERFFAAFKNILTFCLQHSPDGGDVLLEAYAENSSLVIQIKDQGVGLTEEEILQIEKRYKDLCPTYHIPGMGLSMSLVSDILELHGGSMEIHSSPGEGTVIKTLWPLS